MTGRISGIPEDGLFLEISPAARLEDIQNSSSMKNRLYIFF